MYNSAKILLKNDTKEVITYSNKDDKIFSYTKNNDKIKFTPIDEKKNDNLTKSIRKFNIYINNDKRIENLIIPVGDGLTVCRKL